MSETTILVLGMTCGGCERAVEAALARKPGVRGARADHATGRVVVEGEALDLEALRAAVEDAGFDWGGRA